MCDEKPRITQLVAKTYLPIQQYLFMDVGFDIDTTGEISNFTINDFITAPYNEQFKEDLFECNIANLFNGKSFIYCKTR